jgi:hypothetical protein
VKIRRLLNDESGVALGLAVVMIVLIGVMGAGLLTFVQRDLETVVEVNQGQRALETADAGVEAAPRQLASDSTIDHYNGGTNEVRWSCFYPGGGGVELENFDGSDTTEDSAIVTIEYNSADTSFKVISTGEYGGARRKVEAIFKTGTGTGLPAYYTPGDIYLKDDVSVRGVSMFSGRNMIIEPNGSVSDSIQDYERNNFGPLEINTGADDALGDWNRLGTPWDAPKTAARSPR